MKRVYFAGTFSLHEDTTLPLSIRLEKDYRAVLLGDAVKMVNYSPSVVVRLGDESLRYVGPFYCEEAAKGCFTSTDCEVVVRQEFRQVEQSDMVVCVFDTWPSVGTVVELEWAINLKKDILILYEVEENEYTIPTGMWFAIQDAMQRSKKTKVVGYGKQKDIIEIVTERLKEYILK